MAVAVVAAGLWWAGRPADVVVGTPPEPVTTAAAGPTIVTEVEDPPPVPDDHGGGPGGAPINLVAPAPPDGAPWGPPIPFHSTVAVPDDLVFVLVVGSDARPGESVTRTRADSIHILAANPHTGTGTVVGIPRDTWVRIPGRGQGKINGALAMGGPDLLAATVRDLTGLPIHHYVVTGFRGFEAIVDAIGGVVVHVDQTMSDRNSGAQFQRGWHHFNGYEALAFSRNRNLADGDFRRSLHHGQVIVAAAHKARAELADHRGIQAWIGVMLGQVKLDIERGALERIATLARLMDPANVQNVVAPGRIGTAGRQSVVYLGPEAARLFEDLRDDATIGAVGGSPPPTSPPPTSPPTTAPPTTTTTTTPPPTTTSVVEL